MSTDIIKHNDNTKRQFIDYLRAGTDEIIKVNREKLESCIIKEIDIDRAKSIIEKHRQGQVDDVRLSPEFFFALSLVDELPKNIDFRFIPEFKLDGAIFKCVNVRSGVINSKKIPYRKEVGDLLKLQISPDLKRESMRSMDYYHRIVNKLELFQIDFRNEMKSFHIETFRTLRFHTIDKNNSLSFLDWAIACITNKGRDFKDRVEVYSVRTTETMLDFCIEFSKRTNDLKETIEDKQFDIGRLIYSIILETVFPKLSDKKVSNIINICMNLKESIRYEEIWKIINDNYELSNTVCDSINSHRFKGEGRNSELFINQGEIFEALDKGVFTEIDLKISTNTHSFLNFVMLVNRIRSDIYVDVKVAEKKLSKAQSDKSKAQNIIATANSPETIEKLKEQVKKINSKISSVRTKLKKSTSEKGIGWFSTRIKRMESYKMRITDRINGVKSSDVNIKLDEAEKNIIEAQKEIELAKLKSNYQPENFQIDDLYNTSLTVIELENFRAWRENITSAPMTELYSSMCQSLQSNIILSKVMRDKNIDISFDKFCIGLKERWMRTMYPSVAKHVMVQKNGKPEKKKDENDEYIFTKQWLELINSNNIMCQFCESPELWASPKNDNRHLIEIMTGEDMASINNISGIDVLNFMYKGEAGDYSFDDADAILFHHSLIIVRKGNELTSLHPSEGYKQFALNKADNELEIETEEDFGGIQLERFQNILNKIFTEKTKEHFSSESGNFFIESLSKSTGIKFVSVIKRNNDKQSIEEHNLSWGSISQMERDNFSSFLNAFSFIFPKLIPEIHLSIVDPKHRFNIPDDEKELLFLIEKQRDDHDLNTEYRITLEDLMLLGRSNRFYTTILIERAFGILFNRELLNNQETLAQFKQIIGQQNIYIAQKHFLMKRQSISETRIIKKIFIQKCVLLIQNKKEQLSPDIISFLSKILQQTDIKQIESPIISIVLIDKK